MITANAAMRAGAGKITINRQQCRAAAWNGRARSDDRRHGEATATGLARSSIARLAELASDCDAVVAGPGMSPTPVATQLAARLCGVGVPLALDAALLHGLAPAAGRPARPRPDSIPCCPIREKWRR